MEYYSGPSFAFTSHTIPGYDILPLNQDSQICRNGGKSGRDYCSDAGFAITPNTGAGYDTMPLDHVLGRELLFLDLSEWCRVGNGLLFQEMSF